MSDLYKEIMEQVKVTEEMRNRILKNIDEADYTKAKRKVIRFNASVWIKTVAAACIVMLVGAMFITESKKGKVPDKTPQKVTSEQGSLPNDVLVGTNIMEYETVKELSEAAGFGIEDISCEIFNVVKKSYILNPDGIAEIDYQGKKQTMIFSKSKGKIDKNDDYLSCEKTEKRQFGRWKNVTVKEDNNKVYLAVWNDGKYSYSLEFTEGISTNALEKVMKKIK